MRFKTKEDRIVDAVAITVVSLFALICLYPLIYCISMSFSGDDAIILNKVVLWPVGFNFDSYKMVLSQPMFWSSLKNSVVYTVLTGVWQVFWTFQLGYVSSRRNFVFKKQLDTLIIIPMFFGGGLVPSYLLMRSLGLYNNIWAMFIPAAVSIWNSILVKTFIRANIPGEVLETAVIDGANDLQILWKVVVPLSTTIIAIIFMYAAMGAWNDYFNALIYLQDEAMHPLQLYLKTTMQSNMTEMLIPGDAEQMIQNTIEQTRIRYVLVVVISLPVAVLYPFIQKYFVKGVMLGSIKG